jgi:hypothetical protein
MRKNESLNEMVKRRNKRLLNLFTTNGLSVRLVGDENKPAVILNETTVISCFVKNFDLFFTSEPFSNDIIKTVKLKQDPEITHYELHETLDMCTHRPVYKIKLKETDLFLVGYNYLNSEDAVGRYPVFAKHRPKVYFDFNYAQEVADNLVGDGYTIDIE